MSHDSSLHYWVAVGELAAWIWTGGMLILLASHIDERRHRRGKHRR